MDAKLTLCNSCQDFSYCHVKFDIDYVACDYYVQAYARYKQQKTVSDVIQDWRKSLEE